VRASQVVDNAKWGGQPGPKRAKGANEKDSEEKDSKDLEEEGDVEDSEEVVHPRTIPRAGRPRRTPRSPRGGGVALPRHSTGKRDTQVSPETTGQGLVPPHYPIDDWNA